MDSSAALYIGFAIAIIIYITAAIITGAFVLPLQYKEARVQNGLALLRKQMLKRGILGETVIVTSILALTLRFFIEDVNILRILITFIILIHAIGLLGKSIIDLRIYKQQYTPAQKELHRRFAKEERKGKKRTNKNRANKIR